MVVRSTETRQYPTHWAVSQLRLSVVGDRDEFAPSTTTGDDWLTSGTGQVVNLADLARASVVFGTFAGPNCGAVLVRRSGETIIVQGKDVLQVQHEFLHRSIEHRILSPSNASVNCCSRHPGNSWGNGRM